MKKLHIKLGENFELSAEGVGPSVAFALIGAVLLSVLILVAVVLLTGSGS